MDRQTVRSEQTDRLYVQYMYFMVYKLNDSFFLKKNGLKYYIDYSDIIDGRKSLEISMFTVTMSE